MTTPAAPPQQLFLCCALPTTSMWFGPELHSTKIHQSYSHKGLAVTHSCHDLRFSRMTMHRVSSHMAQHPLMWASAAAGASVVLSAFVIGQRRSKEISISMQPTQFNKKLLGRCPTLNSIYQVFPGM